MASFYEFQKQFPDDESCVLHLMVTTLRRNRD